jgi:hypothetical protein
MCVELNSLYYIDYLHMTFRLTTAATQSAVLVYY